MPAMNSLPRTLGELRRSSTYSQERIGSRSVKDELRNNLICRLQRREPLFEGIVLCDTVPPFRLPAELAARRLTLLDSTAMVAAQLAENYGIQT